MAVLREPLGELAGEGRLAGALQAGEHDDGRRTLGELEAALLAAEDRDELLVDDLHDLLGRVERLTEARLHRPLAHGAGELLDDVEVDVGVEQRAPDLAHGAVDIGGGQPALAAEVRECLSEPVGERAEGSHNGVKFRSPLGRRIRESSDRADPSRASTYETGEWRRNFVHMEPERKKWGLMYSVQKRDLRWWGG